MAVLASACPHRQTILLCTHHMFFWRVCQIYIMTKSFTWRSAGCSAEDVDQIATTLQRKGAMAHTTVVAAPPGSSPAQRFVALCTALSFAERVRSVGDHALVVLDDVDCMVNCPALFVPAIGWWAMAFTSRTGQHHHHGVVMDAPF